MKWFTKKDTKDTRRIHHVRVGADDHGTYPTTKELESIKKQFEDAAAKINSKDEFVVTDSRVDISTIFRPE